MPHKPDDCCHNMLIYFIPVLIGLNAAVAAIALHVSIESGAIFSRYGDWVYKVPEWIGKPLGRCYKCMAGQIGFWAGIIAMYNLPCVGTATRCLIVLLSACWSIFFAILFGRAVSE